MINDNKILKQISSVIKKSRTFFIAGHLKPDGDTIGSGLALASLLKRLGKKPELYSKEAIPNNMLFLPHIDSIRIKASVNKKFDCAVILESASPDRMGNVIDLAQAEYIINIDHHATFGSFGHINYINSNASSSAEQIYNLFNYMKIDINKNEAIYLYAGLVTDTGKFQHSNASPKALRMAADLVERGAIPYKLHDKIYANKTSSALRLLGVSLVNLKISPCGKVAYIRISIKMLEEARASVMDTEEIINYCMMMPEVKVGVLIRENEVGGREDSVKISFRSRDGFDVSKFAHYYGGGGHKNAAGCTIKGHVADVEGIVIKKLIKLLEKE